MYHPAEGYHTSSAPQAVLESLIMQLEDFAKPRKESAHETSGGDTQATSNNVPGDEPEHAARMLQRTISSHGLEVSKMMSEVTPPTS